MIEPLKIHPMSLAIASSGPTEAAEAHEASVEILLPDSASTPPEIEVVTRMLLASGSSDPGQALMGVLHQLRLISKDRAERDMQTAEQSREVSRLRHEEAVEAAKAAADRRLSGAPRWLTQLVSVVISAVGVVAAAFTGGASLGLAIAGAVLLLAGGPIAKLGVKLGMSEKAAGWLKLGIEVAGAALMLGAGLAGGASAAAAAPKALNVTQQAVKTVKAAFDAVEHSISCVDAKRGRDQDVAALGATEAGGRADAADDEMSDVLQMLGDELTRMRRESEIAAKMSEESHQTSQRVIDAFGGPR